MQAQIPVEKPKKGNGENPAPKTRKAMAAGTNAVWKRLPHPAVEDLADIGERKEARRDSVKIEKGDSELWIRAKQFAEEGEISMTLALYAAAVSLPDGKKDESARKLTNLFDKDNEVAIEYSALQGLAWRLLTGSNIQDELHTNRFIFAQLPEIMVNYSN